MGQVTWINYLLFIFFMPSTFFIAWMGVGVGLPLIIEQGYSKPILMLFSIGIITFIAMWTVLIMDLTLDKK